MLTRKSCAAYFRQSCSHISLAALEESRTYRIVMLTLHQHASYKLEPLDTGIFEPLKQYYNKFLDSWMKSSPEPFAQFTMLLALRRKHTISLLARRTRNQLLKKLKSFHLMGIFTQMKISCQLKNDAPP